MTSVNAAQSTAADRIDDRKRVCAEPSRNGIRRADRADLPGIVDESRPSAYKTQ